MFENLIYVDDCDGDSWTASMTPYRVTAEGMKKLENGDGFGDLEEGVDYEEVCV